MKIYLIVALFLGALVVAHSLEEEDEKVELPEEPEQDNGGTGDDDTEELANEDEEDEEDEDVDKRRRRNMLSNISCLKLRRRGYCRHLFIRRLCLATCNPIVPCVNKLSRISCIRIRNYRKCNFATGRLYCRRTCGHCGGGLPCRRYSRLSESDRRQSRKSKRVFKCDRAKFRPGWYRFTGLAGNGMPTRAPPKNHCGTHAPGWMVGSYPRGIGQVVVRRVCFHWGKKACKWHTLIRVKKCPGNFFVFHLPKTPACNLRYCGNL